jgi:hypothetical protein
MPAQPSSSNDLLVRQAKASIRLLLHRDSSERPPLSRERFYAVTRHIVSATTRSDDLLKELRVQLGNAVKAVYSRFIPEDASLIKIVAVELDVLERHVDETRGVLAFLDRLYIAEVLPGQSIRYICTLFSWLLCILRCKQADCTHSIKRGYFRPEIF